jgi:hypothetical protein
MPPDDGRDSWATGARPAAVPREPVGGSARPAAGVYGTAATGPTTGPNTTGPIPAGPIPAGPIPAGPGQTTTGRAAGHSSVGREPVERVDPDPEEPVDEVAEIRVVPVRRKLSVAIAGFAGLLAVGLILGAQTSGPDARTPYAIVIFGVQVLYVLAWTMALRPPAIKTVATVSVLAAAAADYVAVTGEPAGLAQLAYVTVGGVVVALLGQLLRRADRQAVADSLGGTLLIVVGVVAFATLIVLTRRPTGTQAILVCLAATGVALVVARLTDAVLPRPRIAPQVPRGATGIIAGAMLGTLAAAALGSVLVLPFTPAKGAVLGLVAAGVAGLVDLAVNYAEAGRDMAGEAPTFWVARHMQGPLGAFALAAPGAYVMVVLFLS